MEILKKLLELISDFLKTYEKKKIEKEEIERVQIEQKEKIKSRIEVLKKNEVKPPKNDDFFNDDNW